MNANLVTIVKQIIVQYGEAVLADPQRLKAFFSDLAKDEPKPLRTAFGRCIEAGAYNALKTAPDKNERVERKATIAQRVFDEHGIATSLCAEALDILEVALFSVPSAIPPFQQPQYKQPDQSVYQQQSMSPPPYSLPTVHPPVVDKRIRNKVGFCFGIILWILEIFFIPAFLFLVNFNLIFSVSLMLLFGIAGLVGLCVSISGVRWRVPYRGLGIAGIVLNGIFLLSVWNIIVTIIRYTTY